MKPFENSVPEKLCYWRCRTLLHGGRLLCVFRFCDAITERLSAGSTERSTTKSWTSLTPRVMMSMRTGQRMFCTQRQKKWTPCLRHASGYCSVMTYIMNSPIDKNIREVFMILRWRTRTVWDSARQKDQSKPLSYFRSTGLVRKHSFKEEQVLFSSYFLLFEPINARE